MKKLLYQNKINWTEVAEYAKKEDVLIYLPDGFSGFKKSGNLKNKINYLISTFDKLSLKHWINFFYSAEFYQNLSNENHVETKDFSKDIVLLSSSGKELDALNFLNEEFEVPKDHVDFNDLISKTKFKVKSNSDYRIKSVFEIGDRAEKFLSKHTLGRYHLDPAAAPFTGVAFEYKTPSYQEYNYGYGRAFDFSTAKHIASLEAVERFASEFYAFKFTDHTKMGTYSELAQDYQLLSFDKLMLEKTSKVSKHTPLYWIPGRDIKNEMDILVPEDLVYYGNSPSRKGYIRQVNDSSNGVALGSNYAEAMISSLLELIERHSFLMTWYGKVPGRRLTNYDFLLNHEELEIIERIKRTGAELNLFEISVFDGIYVVWGLIKNTSNDATIATYTSAGASFSIKSALKSAIMEVAVGYLVQKNYHSTYPELPTKVKTIDDHIDFFANPQNLNAFNFTNDFVDFDYKKSYLTDFEDREYQEEILAHLINETLMDYKDIIFINQTSKTMAESGLYVIKTIIPDFLPMTFGEGNLRISIENINKSRKILGLEEVESYNPKPHPFP